MNENASSLSPVESIVSESSLSPEDSLSERGESPTGEDTGKRKSREEGARKRAVVAIDAAQADRNRWIGRGEREAPPADGGGGEGGGGVARPVNLTLAECQESRPPILKKIVKMRQAKREGRLLSVPNLKFAKNDPTMICDLRCEETNTAPESFTYNLIRRFSKCLQLESSEESLCFCAHMCVRARVCACVYAFRDVTTCVEFFINTRMESTCVFF